MSSSQPKVNYASPSYSAAANIISDQYNNGNFKNALQNDIVNDPFMNQASRQYQLASDANNGMYGARGLANSGIAIAGQQQNLNDILLNEQAQRAGQLTGLLATASSSPSFATGTPNQPRGFLGLK